MKKEYKVLLLIEKSRDYGRGLLKGITKYASLNGHWILEQEAPFYLRTDKTVRLGVDPTKWEIDGIIMRDKKFANKVLDLKIPVIFASYQKINPQTSCIITNNELIGKMAAEHLLGKGFRNFAYLGLKGFYWSQERQKSFVQTIKDNGYKVNIYKLPEKDILWSEERFIVADWLKSLPKPLGLMACNDDRGSQILAVARITSLKIPEDIALVGCDNDEFVCGMATPPLSSVALDVEKAGYQAAQLLDKLMSGKKIRPKKIIVNPTNVVVRRSSDIFAINDSQVVEAIKYIHEHAQEPLRTNDVADAVIISRRGLYDKFKRTFNCKVTDYINRVRIELICQWLTDTDLTISQIAYKFNFSSPYNITKYFRKHKGVNPLQYRNQHRSNPK